MIKIVASDIDGTLLPEGTMELNTELFSIIRRLNKKGIVFVAASGRSIESMEALFEPVKEEIYFISENGAYVKYKGKELHTVTLNRKAAEDFIRSAREIKGTNIVASIKNKLYIEGKNEKLYNHLLYGYHNNVSKIDDVLTIKEDFIKISIYKENAIKEIAPKLIEKWEKRMHVMVAGSSWLDFMGLEADKGNALKLIQDIIGVTYEETMAFGDNHNDIGMLKQAAESYAVANARTEVKKVAKYMTLSNKEQGVLKIIEEKLLIVESVSKKVVILE